MKQKLSILPVYSELYAGPKQQSGNMHLLKHQVETMEAFQDGKSVIAMYPTNELI